MCDKNNSDKVEGWNLSNPIGTPVCYREEAFGSTIRTDTLSMAWTEDGYDIIRLKDVGSVVLLDKIYKDTTRPPQTIINKYDNEKFGCKKCMHQFEPRYDIVENMDNQAVEDICNTIAGPCGGEERFIAEQIKNAYNYEKKYLFDICVHCGEKKLR